MGKGTWTLCRVNSDNPWGCSLIELEDYRCICRRYSLLIFLGKLALRYLGMVAKPIWQAVQREGGTRALRRI